MPIRIHGFPPAIEEPIWLFNDDTSLKAHPRYKDAKAGDAEAAVEIVADMALHFLVKSRKQLPSGACFVAPHAREATGDNAIPQVLAQVCAMLAEGDADIDIVQISRVFHTGADPMERMATRADFEGLVIPGKSHVLVDDITTMGGTLAELANYIQIHGGIVSSVLVLANAGRLKNLVPSQSLIRQIQSHHGHEIEQILGIHPTALTANEANYLIGFRSADEIRNRLAKARKETYRRLRSKGIER